MNSPKKVLKGLFYTLGSGYLARLGSLILTIFIKRELGAGIWEDVILGTTLFMLLSSLREFGLPHALLHYQDRVAEFCNTIFWLNLMLTATVALFSAVLTTVLVVMFPSYFSWTVAHVVWVFSGLHVLRHATTTSEALLRMDFEFGSLGICHSLATLLALTSAFLAARAGWGYWSLILGGWGTVSVVSGVYVVFFSTTIWRLRPVGIWPPKLDVVWTRRLLAYGGWIWLGWILHTFTWWYDKLTLSLFVTNGDRALPFYEHAWWLVQIPTAVIAHIILSYTNTVYSHYQHDRARLSALFEKSSGLIFRISAPLALAFVLNSEAILQLITPAWMAAAPMMTWLAAYAFLRPLLDDGHALLWAVGDTRRSALIMAIQAMVVLVSVPALGAVWGVAGVGTGMGLAAASGFIGLCVGLRRHVAVAWDRVLAVPVVALVLATIGLFGVVSFTGDLGLFDLPARTIILGVAYFLVLILLERDKMAADFAQVRRVLGPNRSGKVHE